MPCCFQGLTDDPTFPAPLLLLNIQDHHSVKLLLSACEHINLQIFSTSMNESLELAERPMAAPKHGQNYDVRHAGTQGTSNLGDGRVDYQDPIARFHGGQQVPEYYFTLLIPMVVEDNLKQEDELAFVRAGSFRLWR